MFPDEGFFGKNIAIVIVLFSYTGFLNTCLCTFNSDYESRIIISAPQDKKSAADGVTAQRSTWALEMVLSLYRSESNDEPPNVISPSKK